MNRSPAEIRDRWLNYGRRYAVHPTLHDSSVACMFGPLAPEGGTLHDYSERTSGAAWSVGAGDTPKYTQGSVRGGSFWAGQYDGSNDYASAFSGRLSFGNGTTDTPFAISTWLLKTEETYAAVCGKGVTSLVDVEYAIRVNENKSAGVFLYDDTTTVSISATTANGSVPVGAWCHLAVTYTGSGANTGLVIWINGTDSTAARGSSGSYVSMSPGSAGFELGAILRGSSPNYLEGSLASTCAFRRVLTTPEIATLARHPLEAFRVEVPKYWSFAPPSGGTHLWPWQIRRSRRVRGHR